MLKMLLENGEFTSTEFKEALEKYGERYRANDCNSAYRVITKEFLNSDADKKRYFDVDFTIFLKRFLKLG